MKHQGCPCHKLLPCYLGLVVFLGGRGDGVTVCILGVTPKEVQGVGCVIRGGWEQGRQRQRAGEHCRSLALKRRGGSWGVTQQ